MSTKLGSILYPGMALVLASAAMWLALSAAPASASVITSSAGHTSAAPVGGEAASSLETVASNAGETGRRVAMSLIGLAFAVAGVTLAFRRDFREAVGVIAVGIVAVLLVTPAGLSLLRATVNTLLGAR